MKKLLFIIIVAITAVISISASFNDEPKSDLTEEFTKGNPEIASIDQMIFGPEGILFLGDSKTASVYAIDTKDVKAAASVEDIRIEGFDKKVAASLGTTIENVKIKEMVVNPISKSVYFAIQITDGTPVLLKLKDDKFENVSLKDIHFSKIALTDPVPTDAKDKWERSLRTWAISDLKYHDGKVLLSGLSNKEFGSTFRSIPFPFNDTQDYASLEVWHAAHGEYETHAPIKTFDIIKLDDKDHIMASYTCTPLVLFPLETLKDGKHTKGRTVAELGAGNSPLDMISYERDGQTYFLMSNSNRPVMRIKYEDIANFKESMTDPVPIFAATEGVPYDNLPFPYVLQMDNLDATKVVYLQRTSDGDLLLRTRATEWM